MRASDEIKLVKPTKEFEKGAINCVIDMVYFGSVLHGTSSFETSENYEAWLKKLEVNKNTVFESYDQPRVPSNTYLAVRTIDKKVVGFLNIRFEINKFLAENGHGHIGYSVMPSERDKGYATAMIESAIKICKKRGMKKIQVGCYEANVACCKTIEANGGVLVGRTNNLIPRVLYDIEIK